MQSDLSSASKVVGVKQSKKVIRDGKARCVLLAQDAESRVTGPIVDLCRELDVPITEVPTMSELGQAAGIAVGAAVVVLTD